MSSARDPLTFADHALLQAMAAWGGGDAGRSWGCLAPQWRSRLAASARARDPGPDSQSALAWLRATHAAEARPDPGRIHPTWWIRALQDESDAVRRVVAASAPQVCRDLVCTALGLDPRALLGRHAPHPEILESALALWSERLVGGIPIREDDPPVIAVLTQQDGPSVPKLVSMLGLAKRSLAAESGEAGAATSRDHDRLEYFRNCWCDPDPRLAEIARQDVADNPGALQSRLGLITIGRLLATAEPHRVRWALQHLPYNAAKFARTRMNLGASPVSPDELVAWENGILQAARARLEDEERVPGDDA